MDGIVGSPHEPARRGPLDALHRDAGAVLAGFAGWSMPLRFAGTLLEHEAVRTAVGVFDVSHLGTVVLEGPDAGGVVATAFTNDPSRLVDGTAQYTLRCDERGGIVDDLLVYRLRADRWLAVPNAANAAAVVSALRTAAADREVTVRDEHLERAVLAVQGPATFALLDRLGVRDRQGRRPGDLPYLGVTELDDGVVLARSGYTGELGVELVLPVADAAGWWRRLRDAGGVPCGLGARDTLRLEMGYPLHGNELTPEVTPFEARLGWAVRADRPELQAGAALRAAREQGPARRLWGVVADGRRPLRAGLTVSDGSAAVGTLTSGGFSPGRRRGIGLALLTARVAPGDRLVVDVRGRDEPVEVVAPPFVPRDPRGAAAG